MSKKSDIFLKRFYNCFPKCQEIVIFRKLNDAKIEFPWSSWSDLMCSIPNSKFEKKGLIVTDIVTKILF